MSPIHLLSKARGPRNLISRIRSVLSRFGISSERFERLLKRYNAVAHNLGCVPTFGLTAVTLARHPNYIKELSQQGVEFAIHGYVHIDYQTIPLDEQVKHFKKAIDTFRRCHIPFTGFRAPFLRVNGHTSEALSNLGFMYDSSHSIHWDAIDLTEYSRYAGDNHVRLLEFYKPRDAKKHLSLPRSKDGLIEIPVSIPDDEAMVERLGITNGSKISEIWQSILEEIHSRGELFTVQLHPERILYCEDALADTIQRAKRLNPTVWITTLREIAEWWQEKDRFTFEINSQGNGRYRVKADCSERATLLLKNSKVNVPVDEWFDGYQSVNARDFVLESPTRPVIGVSQDSSPAAIKFLKSEGFVVERSDQPDRYAIYLGNLAQFNEADEKPLSQEIEKSDAPLLRYWRWPDRARSALSVTGDIDSITIIDFALRILENSLEKWRQQRKFSRAN